MCNSIFFNEKQFNQYPKNKNYYVSRDGDVFSSISKKIIKQNLRGKDNKLYCSVDINIDGKQKHIPVHKMVYESWVRELEPNEQVNHIDDNQMNNNLDNLYTGTQKENIKDCINNGHRVGNINYLTLFDKDKNKVISFCPANDFIEYSGHPNKSGSLQKFFSKNWFRKRYEIIEYKKIKNIEELKGVTTNSDECKDVGLSLSQLEAHRSNIGEDIV